MEKVKYYLNLIKENKIKNSSIYISITGDKNPLMSFSISTHSNNFNLDIVSCDVIDNYVDLIMYIQSVEKDTMTVYHDEGKLVLGGYDDSKLSLRLELDKISIENEDELSVSLYYYEESVRLTITIYI